MLERMLKCVLVAAIVGAAMPLNVRGEPAAGKDASLPLAVEAKKSVLVSRGDRTIFNYRHVGVPMKPYIDRLCSPSGVQVLRDSAPGHEHHHGVMFAAAVDGVGFWAETPKSGTQKERSIETHDQAVLRPDGSWCFHSGFTERLNWISPGSDKPLLIEDRTVAVLAPFSSQPSDFGATLVEWRSQLETPPGKKTAVLTGEHYYGLGMRFVESMDSGGRFFNADDKPGEIVRGDERLTPVKWCAYTAKADGKPVTVAIFDHPENPRHPAKMFTMSTPFAYLSATCNVWKEPITIKAGRPLDLRYAAAVWDGAVDKKTVEKLYQRWLKLSSNN